MNTKIALAALLAVVAVLAVVSVSDDSEASIEGLDEYSISDAEVVSAWDTFDFSDKNVVFSEGGSLTLEAGSFLTINGSTSVQGEGATITIEQGVLVSMMGSPYTVPVTMDIVIDGTVDFMIDIEDLTSMAVYMDISDGGRISMMGGVTVGGPDTEMGINMATVGDEMVVTMVLDLPESAGTMPTSIISAMYPDIQFPFDSIDSKQRDVRSEIVVSMDATTQKMSVTDLSGDGPAFLSVGRMSMDVPGVGGFAIEDMRFAFSLESSDTISIPVSVSIGSMTMDLEAQGTTMSIGMNDLSTELEMSIGADGSVIIGDGNGEPLSMSIGALSASILTDSGTSSVSLTVDANKVSAGLGLTASASGTAQSISASFDIGSAKVSAKIFEPGSDIGADLTVTGVSILLEGNADSFALDASLSKVEGSAYVDDTDFTAVSAEGVSLLLNESGGIPEGSIAVTSMGFSANVPIDRGIYRTVEFSVNGIHMGLGETVTLSIDEIVTVNSAGNFGATESIYGVTTIDPQGSQVSVEEYRATVTASNGSTGTITANDFVFTGGQVVSGNMTYALDHDSYDYSNFLLFADNDVVVGEGMDVTFEDSYVHSLVVTGGTVNGTVYVCADDCGMVSVGRDFTVVGGHDYDVSFDLVDSSIADVRLLPCGDFVNEGKVQSIDEYDPASCGMPYELNDDGTATITDPSGSGEIAASVVLASFDITIGNSTESYTVFSSIPVRPTADGPEGMTFAGWTDGFSVYAAGTDYRVEYDATVTDIWVPTDYEHSVSGDSVVLDLGSDGVFYTDDATSLVPMTRSGGVSSIVFTGDLGSVTVPVEGLVDSPMIVQIQRGDAIPQGYISDAVGGNDLYLMYAAYVTEQGELEYIGSEMAINGESNVLAMDANGGLYQTESVSEDGVTTVLSAPAFGTYVIEDASQSADDGGSDSTMLIIGVVVVLIVIIAIVAVVVMRRRSSV